MPFENLTDAKYCQLTTYRASGTPVPTPVWFVRDGRSILVCSDDPSGKVRRIRRDPRVVISPCNFRGRTTGPSEPGIGRVVAGDDAVEAERTMQRAYSLGKRLFYRLAHPLLSRGKQMVFIRIEPSPSSQS